MSQPIPEKLIRFYNHRLEIRGATEQENQKATALDLLSKAVDLDRSAHALGWNYTYDAISEREKATARVQLGKMAEPIVEGIRDEFLRAGVRWYLVSQGLTLEQTQVILDDESARGLSITREGIAEREGERVETK